MQSKCWGLYATCILSITLLFSIVSAVSNEAFDNPPAINRAKFRYWLPDASVPSETVAKDIASIADVGAGGFEFLPFYLYGLVGPLNTVTPTDWSKYGFGTPAFSALLKSSLQAAKNSSVVMDFAVGAAEGQGVPSEVMTPGLAIELLAGNTTVSSGQIFSGPVPPAQKPTASILNALGFMHQLEQFGTPNLTSVVAFKVVEEYPMNYTADYSGTFTLPTVRLDEGSFIDLTSMVHNGSLDWTAPAGNSTWRIFSFWEQYTNQRSCAGGQNASSALGNGSWTVDHFSASGAARVTDFWDQNLLTDEETANLLKTVGNYAWEDSMEIMAALWWTPGFAERFQSTMGYSISKYLPLMFTYRNSWGADVPPYTEQYVYGSYTIDGDSVHNLDYRSVLNDCYRDYVSHFANWSHSRGFKYSDQPAYNLPLQMLSDIPLLDAPEGESLGFVDVVDAGRQFSGPAHLANISVISSELGAVNTAAYSQTIPNLLYHVKRALASGFTMTVLHGSPYSGSYTNTTWPGYTTFFYMFTDMWNSIQPCWHHMKDTLDYVGRNQFVLQQGVAKVDLALYLFESPWSPKVEYNSTNLQDLGYTYDYLGPDNLISAHASIQSKTLGIPSYKALIFDEQSTITLDAAERVLSMASAGLPVIFIGPTPNQTYPATVTQEAALATSMAKLLQQPNVHRIDSVDTLPSLLASLSIWPRTSLRCSSGPVYTVWRKDAPAQTDYVFFYNDQHVAVTCNASLQNSSGTPYVLNAWTGTQTPVPSYNYTNTWLQIPFTLQANETLLLAVQASPSNSTKPKTFTPATTIAQSNLTIWNISIEDWHSAPDRFAVQTEITTYNFTLRPLIPWTQIASNLSAASGVGHYTTTFTAPSNPSSSGSSLGARLSLGSVFHTARVSIDGKRLPPLDPVNPILDISDHVEAGKTSMIEVEITTPLFNRIKADANQTMIFGTVAGQQQPLYASLPPQQYGLLGPVEIVWGTMS